MIKFRWYLDKDKESDWLNQMAADGYAMKNFFLGFYEFMETEPGEYIYQIDLLDNVGEDKEAFISFMEETGVEVVARWYRWVFLRKKASEGAFEMYTDVESKIGQYERIRRFFIALLLCECLCLGVEVQGVFINREPIMWVCTAIVGTIVLCVLHVVWKLGWKLEQLKKEKK